MLFSGGISAQIGTGQWRLHIPSQIAIDVVALSDRVFTAFDNGVSEYDYSTHELTTWDVVTGLSDITISSLGHSSATNSVFIGYENGNIDHIRNNEVTNIPAIDLAEIQGSKKIHKIVEYQGYMYFATGFAIVKVDPIKNEVRDTYYPTNGNQAIVDVAFRNDTIFALTKSLMYTGDITNVALADPAQWTVDPRIPTLLSNEYREMEIVDNEIFILFIDDAFGLDTVYQLTNTGMATTFMESFDMEILSIDNLNGQLSANYRGATITYTSNYTQDLIISDYGFGTAHASRISYQDGVYWLADSKVGLVKYESGSIENISFSGPPKNEFYAMDWSRGKLAIAGGGVAGNIALFRNSGVYTFENEEWKLLDQTTMSLWAGADIWDYLSVAIDPRDKDVVAVATQSFVPLSFTDASGNIVDTLTPNNSGIEETSIGIGMSLVSSVQYDNSGNLWVLNGGTVEPLKVLTIDGDWQSFNLGPEASNKFSKRMVIDNDNNKWFSFRAGELFGFNDNNTPTDLSDDSYIKLNSGDQSGALPSNEVTALAVDHDNELWIGTDNGFAVLYNASSVFGASLGEYNAQRIKVEFEGNVEFVLGATSITDIEVDGANRKWFGTENAGIILLSADGLEIIEQHTIDNSPLISNTILDLQLDHNTGELFIITDKGLISYRTDATTGDSDYSDVTVFPNPVRPDFNGPITIQGIKSDSDVKITDAAGNVVYQGSSNGGTATWDGKRLTGEPVTTGVYFIWTAPNEGKGRKVGKVLVVR
jgi:ligand-binding sensor domain-containing protein